MCCVAQVRTHAQKYFLKLAKIRSGARNGQVLPYACAKGGWGMKGNS